MDETPRQRWIGEVAGDVFDTVVELAQGGIVLREAVVARVLERRKGDDVPLRDQRRVVERLVDFQARRFWERYLLGTHEQILARADRVASYRREHRTHQQADVELEHFEQQLRARAAAVQAKLPRS